MARKKNDDDIEDADEVVEDFEEVDEVAEKARRQLKRGAFSRFSDRLTGGAQRPGQQSVGRSPFVLIMGAVIFALVVLAGIFFLTIKYTDESRQFEAAKAKLDAQSFGESEKLFESFLVNYPTSAFADAARIGLHKSRVLQYTSSTSFTLASLTEALTELKEFIRVCRDLEPFVEERENVRRFAERITRAGARVAADQRKQEALDISVEANAVMMKYPPEGGFKKELENELRTIQRTAEAEILKETVLQGALSEIRGKVESGDTVGALESRQALIDRYDVLREDKQVAEILAAILDREKESVVRTELGLDALTTDLPSAGPSLSLNLRTQVSGDQVSQGKQVFAVGVDSCYGLDSETGLPVWKRVIGPNAPFPPIGVDASIPSLLTFNSINRELMLLSRKTGELIWRQSIGAVPTSPPLILDQQIYLTTDAGELWQLSVATGRAMNKLTFSQLIVGPPTVSRDQSMMVVAAEDSLVYTLSIRPLECVAVSYIDHRAGSVEAPILTMGDVFLFADNNTAQQARLRVLRLNEKDSQVNVVSTDIIDGHVRDPCLLRGNQLFVPSTPQRVSAFLVTDEPGESALSQVGTNQVQDGVIAPMHLLAEASGELWLASQSLRRFQVTTNSLTLDSNATAEGIHLQPIQSLEESVFVTTTEPYSSSVFFTKIDSRKMTGLWRTVVGTNLVAIGPSDSGRSLLAIADFGEVFRPTLQDIRTGGFSLESNSQFRLPDKLVDPVGGLRLNDGRLAAYCGGAEPALWTISGSGQLEQKWGLPGPPETKPVALDGGIVVAIPGGLHMTANRQTRVRDYRAAQKPGEQQAWKCLVSVNDTQVIAVNSNNELVRVEYRTSPQPHLAEISVTAMTHPIELAPTATDEFLFVATADGHLLCLHSTTLEILADVDLGGIPGSSPFVAGNRVFVDVAGKELRTFTLGSDLKLLSTYPLTGTFLVGPPVATDSGEFVAVRSDGLVHVLNADGQATSKKLALGQNAQQGPIAVADALVVVAVDGSLYSVEHVLE